MKRIHEDQHAKALTCGQLCELLSGHPDSIPCILTSSDAAYSIKRVELSTVSNEATKKEVAVAVLRI